LATHRALKFYPEEQPFCVQVFGTKPERLALGARLALERGAAAVEVNAGCPVPKVTGKGGGAGLLRDLPLLARILRAVKKITEEGRVPLRLKFRLGWDEHSINFPETIQVAASEGVELLTLHGRTRAQGYKGYADWEKIGEAATLSPIPLIGNGDVHSAEDATYKLNTYPVAGLAIGRAAIHNPWIFGQIGSALAGRPVHRPGAAEVWQAVQEYGALMEGEGYTRHGLLGKLKQMAARLAKGFGEEGGTLRNDLLRSPDLDAFSARFQNFVDRSPDVLFAPEILHNLNGKADDVVESGKQW
jgi:nifR3 family TIM-barrel protein